MKRLTETLISTVLIAAFASGCAVNTKEVPVTVETSSAPTLVTTVETTASQTTTSETTTEATTEARGHFEFKPVVMSSIFRDIMGDDMCWAYENYVNAVMAGEDEFEVKSESDYDWMIGQFPGCFSPLFSVYTESGYGGAYKNGKGRFKYRIPKEELKAKEAEFEKVVTDILNENLRDDYSDFEKALALYIYINQNYTYDHEILENTDPENNYKISGYRFLMEKKGICSECSCAYSYLLLQAGVDATLAGGFSSNSGEAHGWSYVTIKGKNYHIDPTYAMGSDNSMAFFMMTDEQREHEDGYLKKDTTIGCHYKGSQNGNLYDADDDFFKPLWHGHLTSWDHEKKLIYYTDEDGNDKTFDYSPFA